MIDSMEQEDFDIRNQQPVTSRERDFENALRPLNFEDFSGRWTSCGFTALPDWEKQHSAIS